jgi:hypothetical protein
MAWKSISTLRREYRTNDGGKKNLVDLFAIRQFVRLAIRSESFQPAADVCDAISLSPLGAKQLERLLSANEGIQESVAKFAIFLYFYHQDLFVDVDKTKIGPLQEFVHKSVLKGDLKYPWLFDHVLYDRAFERFPEVPEHISKEDTETLLHNTPPGVFQFGMFTVGPFGLLESAQTRLFPPRRDLLLSHCSDATCNHAHVAQISVGGPPLTVLTSAVSESPELSGDRSDYAEFIAELAVGYSWYDDLSLNNLPWLLGSAFSERELRVALVQAITSQQAQLRSRFPTDGFGVGKLKRLSAVNIGAPFHYVEVDLENAPVIDSRRPGGRGVPIRERAPCPRYVPTLNQAAWLLLGMIWLRIAYSTTSLVECR